MDGPCDCAACSPTPEFKAIVDKYVKLIDDFENSIFLEESTYDLGGGESALSFSHSHVVFEDGNIEDADILFCLGDRERVKGNRHPKVYDLIDAALRELLAVPRERRGPPEDAECEND